MQGRTFEMHRPESYLMVYLRLYKKRSIGDLAPSICSIHDLYAVSFRITEQSRGTNRL